MDFSDSIIRLIHLDTKERINIKTNNNIYTINKSFAAAISPIFFKEIRTNPMINEIFLPIDENLKPFFKGKSINKELFIKISILLDNKENIKKWKKQNEINMNNINERLMMFIKYKGKLENMVEEMEFIRNNFEEIENTLEIEKIPNEYLTEITKNVQGIKSEKTIFKSIIERYKEEKDENIRKKLLENIEMKWLSNEDLQKLIKILNEENDQKMNEKDQEINDLIEDFLMSENPKNEIRFKKLYYAIINYYNKSENQKHSSALNNIGILYKNGYGVEKDYSKAKEYYEQSAKLHNSDALNNIGDLYLNGYGVEKDYSKAKEYYDQSAKLQNSDAFIKIGELYQNGYGVEQDYSKAMAFYRKSAKLQNVNALIKIGDLFKNGYGVKQDYSKAMRYYQTSLNRGNLNALVNVKDLSKKGHDNEHDDLTLSDKRTLKNDSKAQMTSINTDNSFQKQSESQDNIKSSKTKKKSTTSINSSKILETSELQKSTKLLESSSSKSRVISEDYSNLKDNQKFQDSSKEKNSTTLCLIKNKKGKNKCTGVKTSKYPYPQKMYYCFDCRCYICAPCKENCRHKDHLITDIGYTDEYFCECDSEKPQQLYNI